MKPPSGDLLGGVFLCWTWNRGRTKAALANSTCIMVGAEGRRVYSNTNFF